MLKTFEPYRNKLVNLEFPVCLDSDGERARGMGGHIASITSAKENEDITRISGGRWNQTSGPERPGEVGPGPEAGLMADLGHTRTGGLASRTIMIRAKIGCNTWVSSMRYGTM